MRLTENGESVEVGVIGREGFSGLAALLDQPQMSHSVIMQGMGEGLRIRASIVRDEFLKGGVLQRPGACVCVSAVGAGVAVGAVQPDARRWMRGWHGGC